MSRKNSQEPETDCESDGDEIVLSPKIKSKKQVQFQKELKYKFKVVCKRINSSRKLPNLNDFADIVLSLTNNWYFYQSQIVKEFDFFFTTKIKTPNRTIEFNIIGNFDEDELNTIKDTLIDCLFPLKFMNMKVIQD